MLSVPILHNSLLLSNKVKLLYPSSEHLCINFFWQLVPILRLFEVKLLVYLLIIEMTLLLFLIPAAIYAFPLESIVCQELCHLHYQILQFRLLLHYFLEPA